MIHFAPFEPDKAPYNQAASDQIINVLPAPDGYKPMPTLVDISHALEDECLGAVSVFTRDGFSLYAGTRTKLFRLNTSTQPNSWDNVSKAGGYDVPEGDRWSFAIFGDRLIACQLGDVPQSVLLGSTDAFADIAGAPTARTTWVSGDFLVFGYLADNAAAIQWSGLNDMTHWDAGKKGSDIQTFPDGGEVMAGFGSQQGGIIMQRDKMRYMNFAPSSSYTFTFSEANPQRGALAPYALAVTGPGQFVYLCKDGFFAGTDGTPIGATRVDDWFLNEIDHNYLANVHAVVDTFEKMVWWIFRTKSGENKLLGYDWQLDRWCQSDQVVQTAVSMLSPNVTWDGLSVFGDYQTLDGAPINDQTGDFDAGSGAIGEGQTFAGNQVDAISQSFDSNSFSGGSPIFAAFSADNKLGHFTGEAAHATLETATLELNPDGRTFVKGARLISDIQLNENNQKVQVTVGAGDHHGQNITYRAPASPSTRSGMVPLRASGRVHRFKVMIDEGAAWSAISAIEPDMVAEGTQ